MSGCRRFSVCSASRAALGSRSRCPGGHPAEHAGMLRWYVDVLSGWDSHGRDMDQGPCSSTRASTATPQPAHQHPPLLADLQAAPVRVVSVHDDRGRGRPCSRAPSVTRLRVGPCRRLDRGMRGWPGTSSILSDGRRSRTTMVRARRLNRVPVCSPGRQASRRDAPLGPPATRPAAGASGHGHQEATEQRRDTRTRAAHEGKGPGQWLRSSP